MSCVMYAVTMAHPGSEESARLPRSPDCWAETPEEAQVLLDREAAQWVDDGYTVVRREDGSYVIAPEDGPTKTTHLIIREGDGPCG